MKIALPKEIKSGEYRVAMIPSNVAKLVDAGHTVYVEKDAGTAAGYPDEEYVAEALAFGLLVNELDGRYKLA